MKRPAGPTTPQSCGADRYHVGDPAPKSLPPPNRIIPEGASYTMNYVAGRLNIEVATDGKIVRAWCG
jgi:hypothetical protein